MDQRVHLRITGMVQGVFYRVSAQERARALGLNGWVRNAPDGSVELVAEGSASALDDLELWCHRGPPGARVDRVAAHRSEATGEFVGFRVRY